MPPSRPATLDGWLAYLETLHPRAIALGLDRVRAVLARLALRIDCPVITVTGTNGKGSTTAMLDAMLRNGGYRVGRYTSPHLMRYNERVALDGKDADDATLVAAFHAVEDARTAVAPPTPLTYFEFGTLAALWCFARAQPDVLVLEVGLGGRLDAVNVLDADVAVITAVDLDHLDYLGPTREDVGREKAGILRAGRPAVCGDPDPPASVIAAAQALGSTLLRIGTDYRAIAEAAQWRYEGPGGPRFGLPHPALRGVHQLDNAATAIAALACLQSRLPLSAAAVRNGLVTVDLPGRFMVLPGRPTVVLDVAHNPHAARVLAAGLGAMGFHPETHAVLGMLGDKDVEGVVAAMRGQVDRWYLAPLPGPRGSGTGRAESALQACGVAPGAIRSFPSVASAYGAASDAAAEADRIVVFGSFLTVAAALASGRPEHSPRLPAR